MSTNEPPPDRLPPSGGYGAPPPPPPPTGGYGETPPPPPPAPRPAAPAATASATAFTYGWNKFTANLGQILIAVVVLVGRWSRVQIVGSSSQRGRVRPELNLRPARSRLRRHLQLQNIVQWASAWLSWIVSMIIGAGIVRGALDITEGRELERRRRC